ncbi:MAG: serine/threonine protein kinase [Rhodocyclaceae bacterium]|nr:serine/threonine protein kinase [Rhodocyclaceae bacterium]
MPARFDPRLRFGLAVASAIVRGRFRFPGGQRPPAGGHVVDPAFAGVGVAAAADPEVDDFIVERLRAAGIRHVRVDFSGADEGGDGERLLARLLAEEFRVTLHLVQLREDALAMPDERAAARWRAFVSRTLDRYGAAVERVELGTTVNRQRWCGHSLSGFLSMWEIGWHEVRRRGLTLMGPGVTDFEPPWNVGMLALLAERGLLPDIHTDNLFSERCTEPERFDHKILGRRLVRLHKFNLIKKARLLARLGADHGVPRLVSPSAFWTLPRIERMLPDSEEKQADYLTRYMLLCAASGALERAWWGPLICHREGLVDNGERPYPALERITHYASVEGGRGDLRVRPALHALHAFAALVPGACYEGRLSATEGLEVHAFRSTRHLIHAVWTINGRAAALADLYSADDLAAADFRSRDGIPEDAREASRVLVGESPRYLCWPASASVELRPGAALLPGVALAWHRPGCRHFHFRERGWEGIVVAGSLDEASRLLGVIHPDRLVAPSREAALRHARNAVWTVSDPRRPEAKLVVKQPVKMYFHKKLLDRLKPSKGLRSWSGTCELLRRGIGVAVPVAWFEWRGDTTLMRNFYVCEHVRADFAVREMFAAFARGEPTFAGIAQDSAYRQLCDYLHRMHGRGIFFRDLSGGNILASATDDGTLTFSLIDTGRIHAFDTPLSSGRRLADMVRICNKLDWHGRDRLMSLYMTRLGRRFDVWSRLKFALYDLKVWLKRSIGRRGMKRLKARVRGQ